MLRRAADMVGASGVLFVTHSPDIAALADATIQLGDGQAVVS
jgi:ABC-type lipoprotein export system ATPase subunit